MYVFHLYIRKFERLEIDDLTVSRNWKKESKLISKKRKGRKICNSRNELNRKINYHFLIYMLCYYKYSIQYSFYYPYKVVVIDLYN